MNFLFAFLSGLLLNGMPCVFPVLSLKVLSLLKRDSSSISGGWWYALGISVSFFILSGILVLLKSAGFVIGWGYNLQSPIFVILLTYLLFVIGLNFSGVFSIPMLSMRESVSANRHGAFFTGVLAVLVATPCTGPFMATAIGFAFTQPTFVTLMIFQALGLGFSFPYLLFSFFPKLLCFLPQPGEWMNTFKQFLAFPMYLSSTWLLWVLIKESNANLILSVVTGAVLIVFTIWLWGVVKYCRYFWKSFFIMVLLFVNYLPLKISYDLIQHSHEREHVEYSESVLSELLEHGQKVLVVVSADWCITCKINEKLVLSSDTIYLALKKHDVVYLFADITKHNANITRYMASFDRLGVPLYVLYSANGVYKILPQLLTQQMLLGELEGLE